MYRGCDEENCVGARIYRSPDEIRLDMCEARLAIEKINEKLNVRSLAFEMISQGDELEPGKLVSFLEDMHSEAEEALAELYQLNELISELEEELYEVKCVIGI